MIDWYEKHRPGLAQAAQACRSRGYYTPFADTPQKHPAGTAGARAGAAAFEARRGREFALDLPGRVGWCGEELSPYTGEALGIRYPQADPDALFAAAQAAIPRWRDAGAAVRLGVLMEVIERLYARLFELTLAGMHTTGQSYAMSYAGSGTNALDRAIEALVYAERAMAEVPAGARWERAFGKATIRLDKRYRLMPRGVAVCFTCASFPCWNAWPSMMASLATGNAVIAKPHPATVLPMAITVEVFRAVLAEAGFAPDLVGFALDTVADPIGKRIVKHPGTAIVDFAGSAAFGAWIEANAPPALVYTETSGVNTVVIESTDDLDAMAKSLATTLSLFSAQMCTSPQNLYIPRGGIDAGGRHVAFDEVVDAITGHIRELAADPVRAGAILAAIQSTATPALIDRIAAEGARHGRIALASAPYRHPEFAGARTRTPLMVALDADGAGADLYRTERFGPISFAIACDSAAGALAQATGDARREGAITGFLYSADPRYVETAETAYAEAGAQLTVNLTGPMPLNFAAAYSDYHVTGLNPAGNASLTDAAFVAARFRIAQSRRPAGRATPPSPGDRRCSASSSPPP